MSKHTPGPWTFWTPYGGAIGPSVRQVRIAAYHTEYGPEIALCDCDPTEGTLATKFPPITREQRVANAYLISAAPDLLEALQNMMRITGTIDEALNDAGLRDTLLAEYQLTDIDDVFEMGHIALAHADGREYKWVEEDKDA